MITSYMLLASF